MSKFTTLEDKLLKEYWNRNPGLLFKEVELRKIEDGKRAKRTDGILIPQREKKVYSRNKFNSEKMKEVIKGEPIKVIEVKKELNRDVIGQVEVAAYLAKDEFDSQKASPVIVCGKTHSSLKKYCDHKNIEVWVAKDLEKICNNLNSRRGKKKNPLLDLYKSKKSVFSTKSIALLWEQPDSKLVKSRIHRYIKAGKLYSIRKGFYAKDENYNKYELATKIYTPSYISFETVLGQAGIIFQYYGQIFATSYLSREITADGQTYVYKKIKDSVLTNDAGIEQKENYFVATPERAFLDLVYLNKNYYFDNLSEINWDKVFEILPIYSNKRMEKSVREYRNNAQDNK